MIAERAAVTRCAGVVSGFCAASVTAILAILAAIAGGIGIGIGIGVFAPGTSAIGGGTAALLVGALLGAAAVAAIAIVLVSQATGAAPARDARGRCLPRADVDLPTLVAESHPDAAGHVRSRAPGAALPAA